jgi:hypothetical protein
LVCVLANSASPSGPDGPNGLTNPVAITVRSPLFRHITAAQRVFLVVSAVDQCRTIVPSREDTFRPGDEDVRFGDHFVGARPQGNGPVKQIEIAGNPIGGGECVG